MDLVRRYVAYAMGRWGKWSVSDAGSPGLSLDRDTVLPLGLAMSPVAEFLRDGNLAKMDRETAASILRHLWDTAKTRTGDFWVPWKVLWSVAARAIVSRPAQASPDTGKWKRGVPPFDDIWGWGYLTRRQTDPNIDAEKFQGHGVMALACAAAMQLDAEGVTPVSPTPSPAVDYNWIRQLMGRLDQQTGAGVTPAADEPSTRPGATTTPTPGQEDSTAAGGKKKDGNGLAILVGLYLAHKEGLF